MGSFPDTSAVPIGNERRSDKLLFTPGPLTTSRTVKEAMLHDLGSRDSTFIETVSDMRRRILRLGGVSQAEGYEAIFMQGSGTFGLESVISSTVPADGKLLVVVNGAYGERVEKMSRQMGVKTDVLRCGENEKPTADAVARVVTDDDSITNVSIVHCETTTGIVNPIAEIGRVVKARGCWFMVDAMSSFGAIPIDMRGAGIDFLVTSANKCLEGVPGCSIILACRDALVETEGSARSLSLDLQAQWRALERNGQFRFTPPTHAILALAQALNELEEEGGVEGRGARYRENHDVLMAGMRRLGFRTYLDAEDLSCIITSFLYPRDGSFAFESFYQRLNERGHIIYPGKVTLADCFRIGTIGRITSSDVEALVESIEDVLDEMNVETTRVTQEAAK